MSRGAERLLNIADEFGLELVDNTAVGGIDGVDVTVSIAGLAVEGRSRTTITCTRTMSGAPAGLVAMTLPRLGFGFGDPGAWTHGIVGGRRKWGLRADDALDLTTWLVMATEPLEALLAVGGVATLERTRLVVDISGTRRLRTGLVTDVVASASALFEE